MNQTTHFDPWHDRHEINMEPEQMNRFSDEDSLFAGQPNEKQYAIADALDSLPNERYRRLLVGVDGVIKNINILTHIIYGITY